MTMRRLEQWTRTHRTAPPVTVTAITSPIDDRFIVRANGWQLPAHFSPIHPTLEAAQRAADDIICNNLPHDCRQAGCSE